MRVCLIAFAVCLTWLAAWPAPAARADDAATYAFRAEVADHFTQLLRGLDPAVQVLVSTTPRRASLTLPGTPFQLKDARLPGASGEPHFARVEVTIVGSRASWPPSLPAFLKSLIAKSADEVDVQVRQLPDDVLRARQEQGEAAAKGQGPRAWEQPLTSTLTKAANLAEQTSARLAGVDTRVFKQGAYLALGLALITGVFIVIALILALRSQRQAVTALKSGFAQLTAAYEAGATTSPAFANTAVDAGAAGRAALPATGTAAISPTLAALPDESLLALLADCYWTNQDQYGAYLWRRIPTERKLPLLKALPLLDGYAAFIRQLPEQDLGFEQDPSYLNPLPLWHLDTAAVTELVRDQPALMRRLSPLRSAGLDLRPSERLQLASAGDGGAADIPLQVSPASSVERPLPRALQIQIRSDDEEREVLALPEPPLSLIADVPSLGWLLKLPKAQLEALLQPHSARDLASAWVGPPEVLAQLGEALGEKKREMIAFQITKMRPSRRSPTFAALHRAAVAALREAGASPEESQQHAA